MRQSDFGEMIDIRKSTFSRFMGAGAETTGKGSHAYPAILRFFDNLEKAPRKERNLAKSHARSPSSQCGYAICTNPTVTTDALGHLCANN